MKEEISTSHAPSAIGPYSQAVVCGNWLFSSGQIPINPQSNELINGPIAEQTQQVLNNIKAILSARGLTIQNIIKITIFLTDLNNFDEVNSVYASFFEAPFPARSTVQVAALPLQSEIEIEFVAKV